MSEAEQRWRDLRDLTELYREGLKDRLKHRQSARERFETKAQLFAVSRVLTRMSQLESREGRA